LSAITVISEHACFAGVQGYYSHQSETVGTPMRFAVFTPPQAKRGAVPVLYYLAGLTCTEETFVIKAGAQRVAAELGLMLVAPDTSPRGANVPGEDADWDFGTGAGFYVDATREPWSRNYRMYSYVTRELPAIIAANFPAASGREGIFGHSMGGHGALICALKNPGRYRSLSAFAPISAPMRAPWGIKAFSAYLGDDRSKWADWDASELMRRHPFDGEILVDQGLADKFLVEQLQPERLEEAARASGQALTLRRHAGYDHSYFFIATFVEDHLRHHALKLLR
jgi:S-formylglutathione hydrolase